MSPEQLVNFMRVKLENNAMDIVAEESTGAKDGGKKKAVTLVDTFSALKLTAADINVHALDTQSSSGNTFHRFDRFNMKYDLFGSAELRDIFLKKKNHQDGKYLGEMTQV